MTKSAREKLVEMLNALKDRIASPSDVIAYTGLPRYEVLASFHVLEALGLIEIVYSRGNYRLYRLTSKGEQVLRALKEGKEVVVSVVDKVSEEHEILEQSIPGVQENSIASAET